MDQSLTAIVWLCDCILFVSHFMSRDAIDYIEERERENISVCYVCGMEMRLKISCCLKRN